MKTCTTCQKQKPLDLFNKNKSSYDGLQSKCRECDRDRAKTLYHQNGYKEKVAQSNRMRRTRAQNFVWNYLLTHPCVDCGEDDPVVLEFDHINPQTKGNNISTMANRGNTPDRILKEIELCEVRCANCHKKKTAKQFGFYKNITLR